MAQKREKEETELKVPETLTICAPSMPAAPPPKLPGKDDQASSSARSPESSDPKLSGGADDVSIPDRSDLSPLLPSQSAELKLEMENQTKKREVKRCSGCRRKVGLMGFRCRCGEIFCSEHRYSDRHDCDFDYKAAGREAIARENPVVRAAKILKV